MIFFLRFFARAAVLAAALAAFAVPAAAGDAWPDKPITLVVPWPPGGTVDILARVIARHMEQELGQPTIVENRSGASGNIGSAYVARARPDGYTLLFGTMSTHAMNPALYANMPFDGVKAFTAIAEVATVTNTMVINPALPVHNVAELVAYAKAHPGAITYASAGVGSVNHLSAALFEHAAGIRMVHVPYRGGAPALLDTVAGRTQLMFSVNTQTAPYIADGRLKLLAVTEDHRSPLFPAAPTVAETVPGYRMASVWFGLLGPAGMDQALSQRLNDTVNRTMALPDVARQMQEMGVQVVRATPAGFAAALANDADRYGKLIRELGIRADQ